MRFHRRYSLLQCWAAIPEARNRIDVRHLALARFEPSMSYMRPSAMLDVVFCDGDAVTVIPYADVVVEMLQERERTPVVWPAAFEDLAPQLAEIEAVLLPWLQSLTLARQLNSETVRRFSDVLTGEEFDRARSARFLGAAPYTGALAALAPYVYASRFNAGSVALRDPDGAGGAAVLAATGARVSAMLNDRSTEALASKWFSRDIFGEAPARKYDLAIGPAVWDVASPARIVLDRPDSARHMVRVATPAPSDIMVSFDREDSPAVREFGVNAPEPALRGAPQYAVTAAAGGSSGKILLLLRDGFDSKPNADSDEAFALAKRLRGEGFQADLVSPARAQGAQADLVHAFGMENAVAQALAQFKERGTPTVLTPSPVPRGAESAWGTEISHILFTGLRDEASLEEQLRTFERRLLQTNPAGVDPVANSCAAAHVVLARSAGEELRLRESLGQDALLVRADGHLAGESPAPEPIGPLAGTKPFVFAHAPLAWESNLVFLARIACKLRIPLVVAGPTADVDAVITARAAAPGIFVHLADPSEGQLEALYRTARVYADVSWRSHGAHRVRRAAASGCALLLSRAGGGADFLPEPDLADPASEAALTQTLQRVWEGSARPEPYVPADAFAGIVAAYAAAQQLSVHA